MSKPRWPLLVALALSAGTAQAAPPAASAAMFEIPFEKLTLPNGLEVILHRDSSLPLVAVNIWYHVGPSSEPKGRSGFAHLFEHLMFEGSKHVGHRFDALLEGAGATNANGTTSWDRTNYYETVPREHLELVLWIESDRMGFMLDALSADRLEVQRGVVKNERRESFENAPYGPSSLALLDAMFPEGHPYHGAIIGSMKDLDAATMQDVTTFFHDYYAPSNATLALAGDFDREQALTWIERYFGTLPKLPKPARSSRITPPLQRVERVDVDEPVELGKVSMGFIVPPAYSKDEPALLLASSILAGGKATRLYRELVVQKKLASEVSTELDPNALCGMFIVSAVAASGKREKDVEAALDRVLAGLAKAPPSKAELERARRRVLVELASSIQRVNGSNGESGRAGLLQRFNHYLGDPGYLPKLHSAILAVTAKDVSEAVARHLDLERRVVVTTHPTRSSSTKVSGSKQP